MKKITSFTLILTTFFLLMTTVGHAEPRRVLLEYVTGTWCQWCPCGDSAVVNILRNYPQTIPISYHGPANSGNEPFSFFNGNAIISMLGFSQYPTAIIERMNNPYNFTYPSWNNRVVIRYATSPNTDVNVVITSKAYNTGTRQLTANISSTALVSLGGQYKISYVLTEDGLIYPQQGNGTCPGSSNWEHNWVVRNMINGPSGENLNTGGVWNQNQTINTTVATTVNGSWVDNNCHLIIFVYKDSVPMYYAQMMQGAKQSVTASLGIEKENNIPAAYFLSQNYPNPFNPVTNIKFEIPRDGNVSLKIYDAIGNEVAVFWDGFMRAGTYNAEFDGSKLSSGVYFYRLTAGDFSETKKMILSK